METNQVVIDYTTQLQIVTEQQQQIIELLEYLQNILAQINVDILFCIGVTVPLLVCFVLYKAIKKFI